MVFPALVEEGDDPVGELAEGHRIEGRGVEPVDDERAVTADPFEAFPRRRGRSRPCRPGARCDASPRRGRGGESRNMAACGNAGRR